MFVIRIVERLHDELLHVSASLSPVEGTINSVMQGIWAEPKFVHPESWLNLKKKKYSYSTFSNFYLLSSLTEATCNYISLSYPCRLFSQLSAVHDKLLSKNSPLCSAWWTVLSLCLFLGPWARSLWLPSPAPHRCVGPAEQRQRFWLQKATGVQTFVCCLISEDGSLCEPSYKFQPLGPFWVWNSFLYCCISTFRLWPPLLLTYVTIHNMKLIGFVIL